MIGKTLGVYFALTFVRNTLFIFAMFFFLIVAVDLIELTRQLSQSTNAGFSNIFIISILRAPAFAENVLPFAVLFGASASLIMLNRRLELVVARASGVSVWQFLFPLILSAALLGLVSSFAYNPLGLLGQLASKSVQADLVGEVKGGFANTPENFWLRLSHEDGDVLLRARVAQDAGTKLTDITAYQYDARGDVVQRHDAEKAVFEEQADGKARYRLTGVKSTVPGELSQFADEVIVSVNISRSQLESDLTTAENISIWSLGEQAARALVTGKNALPFLTRFQALLSTPLLFVAMVLVAASVSLRFARFGLNGKAILGGVLAGFMLYVSSKLVVTFGSNGLVHPFFAAWSPAIVASLIGSTVLLHQEDG